MANFFEDNDDIQFLFDHLDFRAIAEVQEDGFAPKDEPGHEYAPLDADEAVDNYRRMLSIVGEIAGTHIAPRAEDVDRKGNTLNDDGTVTLGEGVQENLRILRQAEVMGTTLPRRYGGLNCPCTIHTMSTEIVARADAGLVNIFGLQGIAETINAFAEQSIKDVYLPKFAEGEVSGAMALTEPDAGSDLQAIALRATQDDDGKWWINGVKRFITNGCGDVILTLARSEPDIKDGRGLSLFLVEGGRHLRVRRLENKLGIHGSPTCELVYDNAPGLLIGERQLGLIRYVMALMNGARLGIAAQSLGIAEAAYRVARRYAHTRTQFNVSIERLPAVAEMVTGMKIAIEAARALVYETSRIFDFENNNLRVMETNPPADKAEEKERKANARVWKRLNGMLTPMSKYYASEMCVSVANDAIQVLGGSGYMADYPVERHMRDARITTIYEGTSQLQIVAAVRGVCSGAFQRHVETFEEIEYFDRELQDRKLRLTKAKERIIEGIAFVKQHGVDYMDLYGRKLVDSALTVLIGHLLLRQGKDNDRKKIVASRFIDTGLLTLDRDMAALSTGDTTVLKSYEILAGPVPAAEG